MNFMDNIYSAPEPFDFRDRSVRKRIPNLGIRVSSKKWLELYPTKPLPKEQDCNYKPCFNLPAVQVQARLMEAVTAKP